ncbi:MAG: DUF2162 family putative transporter [Caldimicrobium sp.]
MKEQLLYFIGLSFSLSAFALKVAMILPIVEERFLRVFILGTYALFFLSGYGLINVLESHIFFLLEKGIYLHFLLAGGLLFWGLSLLFRPATSHKALFIYLFPCPVCLTSLLLITLYYKKIFPSSTLSFFSPVIPLFFFLALTLSFYFFLSRILKISHSDNPKEFLRILGLFMSFSGLYILGSFYFPKRLQWEFLGINQTLNPMDSLKVWPDLSVIGFFLISAFLLGFLKSKPKEG